MSEQKKPAFSFTKEDPSVFRCGRFHCNDTNVHFHCSKCDSTFDSQEKRDSHQEKWNLPEHTYTLF